MSQFGFTPALQAPATNEVVLYQSSAQYWVYSSAKARLGGFAIGSTSFMAGFYAVALLRKWNAQRAKWRAVDEGWVVLTSERIRVAAGGETNEFPYGLLRELRYESDRVLLIAVDGDQLKIRASDPAFFRKILEQAARPKLWRPLPLESLRSSIPIELWEQRGVAFSFGLPNGWGPIDLQTASQVVKQNVVAGATRNVGARGNPTVLVTAAPGPMRRADLERVACALPSMQALQTPGSTVVGSPRRLEVGGELGIAGTLRCTEQGVMLREMRVSMARDGVPYNANYDAEDGIFDRYLPEFEAMLANWRWRNAAPSVSQKTQAAPLGKSIASQGWLRKRLLPATGLFVLASFVFSQSSRASLASTGAITSISALGPNVWIGWALLVAAVKVLFARQPGLRTQNWGRFVASWSAATLAAYIAALYWIGVRGTAALSSPQEETGALLWMAGAALVVGLTTRWAWSRIRRLAGGRV